MITVLDSWAILRYLEGVEPAAQLVADCLDARDRPLVSWMNLGEVYYVICRSNGQAAADETVRDLREVAMAEPVSDIRIVEAARIKSAHPMAYADAFAAATAMAHDAEVWTGDPELLVAGAPWRWRDLRADRPDRR